MAQTTKEQQAFKSKVGYHACDKETFLKLKKIHARFCRAQKTAAAWHRWDRKAPRNRVIRKAIRKNGQKIGSEVVGPRPEPEIDEMFAKKLEVNEYGYNYFGQRSEKTYWTGYAGEKPEYLYLDKYKRIITNGTKYRYLSSPYGGCIEIDSRGIDQAYRKAKKIYARPEDVKDIGISIEEIDKLFLLIT